MSTTTSADGTPIGYQQSGEGDPLVLVDGAFGYRAAGPSGPLAALLDSRFTVYAYDRRGRGESGDIQPYAVDREVEDLAAVIEQAGGSAYVYGTSSGARLVLRALEQGLDITALALWEPNFIVDDSRDPMPADYVAHLEDLVRTDRREEAVEYFMTAGAGLPAGFAASLRGTPALTWMTSVAHTLPYDGMAVDGMTFDAERYAHLTVPTLVLHGGTTPWLTAGGRALATALPAGTHRELSGQQHNVEPDAIAPVLVEFFTTVAGHDERPCVL